MELTQFEVIESLFITSGTTFVVFETGSDSKMFMNQATAFTGLITVDRSEIDFIPSTIVNDYYIDLTGTVVSTADFGDRSNLSTAFDSLRTSTAQDGDLFVVMDKNVNPDYIQAYPFIDIYNYRARSPFKLLALSRKYTKHIGYHPCHTQQQQSCRTSYLYGSNRLSMFLIQ
jgi:hypothetical protein